VAGVRLHARLSVRGHTGTGSGSQKRFLQKRKWRLLPGSGSGGERRRSSGASFVKRERTGRKKGRTNLTLVRVREKVRGAVRLGKISR